MEAINILTWTPIIFLVIVYHVSSELHSETRIRRQGISFGGSGSGRECVTPDNEAGTCISLPNCGPYAERATRVNRGDVIFLRQATCGYDGFQPIVCCPQQERPSTVLTETTPRIELPPTTTTTTTPPPLPTKPRLPETCGFGGDIVIKVVGGQNATLGQWPWTVAIFNDDDSRLPNLACGGTLISEEYVVTAAHCTMNKAGVKHPVNSYSVRLGDLDIISDSDSAQPVTVRVAEVKSHPKFNLQNFHDDIALLRLEQSVTFTSNIQPACLPTKEDAANVFTGEGAVVTGWGTVGFDRAASPLLQYLLIPILSQTECARSYARFRTTHPIVPSQMCAGILTGGKDACQGDSGGPLVIMDNTRSRSPWMLVGIVSFGFRCAEVGFPGIYTRVTSYLDWIENNLN